MKPYQPPETNDDSLLAMCGLTLYVIALALLILLIFGCTNPVAPKQDDRDSLVIRRSCLECHVADSGIIIDKEIE